MMEFAHPPPVHIHLGGGPPAHMGPPPLHIGVNISSLPPSLPPPILNNSSQQNSTIGPINATSRPSYLNNPRQAFRPFVNLQRPLPGPLANMTLEDFDGKRLRKSVMRKTVDYNAAIITALENRIWQRDFRDRRALQPDVMYYPDMMPPPNYPDSAINCVTTRFVKTATNKMRCPIFCMAWTPEGRRLVTGASSGEFTLWNGLTFNFETILQAHDSPVRCMVWSHNDNWMVTGDHAGYVKYWQSNMNNVKMFQAHKEALRGISFSPTDAKFVTCSDDGTLRIWDFLRYQEERILRGHGADVKCVHWHPHKGIIISGSKDNQQPIKLWDPKTGQSLATLHAHKATVMDLKWNENGNWLITASRDHLLKLFDLRNLNQEVQTFRGHKKEASSVAWHPVHEGLFCSGGSDGAIMFWHVGADKEVGAIEQAHDSIVWTLAWHPLGHILCSGSNDHTSKFWTRNRPGDQMRDKYNLNTLPAGIAGEADVDIDEPSIIPGMGPEDKVEYIVPSDSPTTIPGLDLDSSVTNSDEKQKTKKVPYSKPIPRNFQAQWNETIIIDENSSTLNDVITQLENNTGVVPLQKIASNANGLIMCGKFVAVEPGSRLESVIAEGPKTLYEFILDGHVPELHDVMDQVRKEYKARNGDYSGEDNEDSHKEPKRLPSLIPDLRDIRLDQDMRQINKFGDSDMRVSGADVDFRNPNSFRQFQDQDMRQFGSTRDQDFRMPFESDQDFRNLPEDHNDFDEREYQRPNSNFNQNFNNFRVDEDEDDESWNQNDDNYRSNRSGRSRGTWGSRNNSRKPRRGGPGGNKRLRGHSNDKQGSRDGRRSRF